MKNQTTLLLIFLCCSFISCDVANQMSNNNDEQTQNATFYGHWKCDRSGTMIEKSDGQTKTDLITVLYDEHKMTFFEYEIKTDGTLLIHMNYANHPTQTETTSFTKNYQNNPNKILVGDKDSRSNYLFSQITNNTMKLLIDADNEGNGFLNLNLIKIGD